MYDYNHGNIIILDTGIGILRAAVLHSLCIGDEPELRRYRCNPWIIAFFLVPNMKVQL